MRIFFASAAAACLAGCSAFPSSVYEASLEIEDFRAIVECELAAAAADPTVPQKDFDKWSAVTDLDLTLVRGLGVDGNATVTAPAGPGAVSFTPRLGVTGTDTRIGHIQFSTNIKNARIKYGQTCRGANPSETNIGLANWVRAVFAGIGDSGLSGITYTKSFEILATAGVRFGYTLVPVTNPVVADAGPGGSFDKTNRFSLALAPPPPPKEAILVYFRDGGPAAKNFRADPGQNSRSGAGESGGRTTSAPSASTNPQIFYLLNRKSPFRPGF